MADVTQQFRDRSTERPKAAWIELLSLAAPTVAQMASYTLMQFIDTWLLSRHGTSRATGLEPTAASNSGMFSFSLISLGFGALILVNTLVSQSFGRGDRKDCGRYMWQGIWMGGMYWLLMLLLTPWAPALFRVMGHEPRLVAMEAAYLRIMIFGAILKLTQVTLSQFMLGIDRPMAVLYATLGGVSLNAVAAWALINGRLGLPMLGIRGSAWGQIFGMFVEMAVLIAVCLRREIRTTYGLAKARFDRPAFMTLLKVGLPSGVQLSSDVMAWTLFSVWVMAPFGTDTMAANTFTFRFNAVSFMPAYGIGTAVTAVVGRYIGRGEPQIAVQRAHLGFCFAGVYMILCGIVFFVGRRWLLELFTQNPHILQIGSMMLIYAAIYQFFDAMYIIYNGALRGAGDTLVAGMTTAGLCWGVTVLGAGSVARFCPQFGPAGPWAAATLYGIVLGLFMFIRFYIGPWRKIRLGPTPLLAS